MSPMHKIKKTILVRDADNNEDGIGGPFDTDKRVDEGWEKLGDEFQDYLEEFRCGGVETEIEPPCNRNYESKSMAYQMDDGSWVGWTFWCGGGKHGNPEEIPWMEDAYELECTGEKTVVVRTFRKVDAK